MHLYYNTSMLWALWFTNWILYWINPSTLHHNNTIDILIQKYSNIISALIHWFFYTMILWYIGWIWPYYDIQTHCDINTSTPGILCYTWYNIQYYTTIILQILSTMVLWYMLKLQVVFYTNTLVMIQWYYDTWILLTFCYISTMIFCYNGLIH